MHFGGLEDDRKDSTAPHITLRPQLGAHRQCGLAICTFHLGFSLGVWLGDGSRDAPLVHCDHNDEPHYQRIAQAAGESWRILGISEQTFYRWMKKFQGMGVAEVRRLRVLGEENRKLKQLVADLSLDKQTL